VKSKTVNLKAQRGNKQEQKNVIPYNLYHVGAWRAKMLSEISMFFGNQRAKGRL
jgi:hypothetical protein